MRLKTETEHSFLFPILSNSKWQMTFSSFLFILFAELYSTVSAVNVDGCPTCPNCTFKCKSFIAFDSVSFKTVFRIFYIAVLTFSLKLVVQVIKRDINTSVTASHLQLQLHCQPFVNRRYTLVCSTICKAQTVPWCRLSGTFQSHHDGYFDTALPTI